MGISKITRILQSSHSESLGKSIGMMEEMHAGGLKAMVGQRGVRKTFDVD
jgi:hypothetical protein